MSAATRIHPYRRCEFTRRAEFGYDVGMSDYHRVDNMTIETERKHENVVKPVSDNPSRRKSGPNPAKPPGKMGRPARTIADRETMRAVGQRLLWAREALGLTQQQVADLIGLDHSTWCYYEKGKRYPDPMRVPAICARLNVDIAYLLEASLDGVERSMAIRLAAHHPELLGIDGIPGRPRSRRT